MVLPFADKRGSGSKHRIKSIFKKLYFKEANAQPPNFWAEGAYSAYVTFAQNEGNTAVAP